MTEKVVKKAVIASGGKQYLVREGEELSVDKLADSKNLSLEALLIIDGDKTSVGTPWVEGSKVTVEIIDQIKAPKVTAIRYKAKKRVRKVRGHRQQLTRIKITKIS